MRIKQEYQVREVAGENIVILQGRYGASESDSFGTDYDAAATFEFPDLTFNDSALLMWNELFGKDFTAQDAAAVLLQNYEVEEATAQKDAQLWIGKLTECNLLE